MAGPVSGVSAMETSAISVLTRAVELDNQRRFTEATVCYQEGLELLMKAIKATTEPRKSQLREKALQFMDRAEKVKEHCEEQKEAGKYQTQIHIANDSTGHSYSSIFGPYLGDAITNVVVEDPYVRANHQLYNFLRFCELLVKTCQNLKNIKLVTTLDDGPAGQQQMQSLAQIKKSLKQRNIILDVENSETLHDREIRLNSGWIIKIGRGLDYFKAPEGKFSLGFCDLDLRPCHETTVDIFHSNLVKNTKE